MGRCSKRQALSILKYYQEQVEEVKSKIYKNFSEMDLENNHAKEDMNDIIDEIESECNKLYNYIENKKYLIRD